MVVNLVLILTMTLCGSLGALFLSKAANTSNGIIKLIKNWQFYLGGGLYFFSALISIILLKTLKLSLVLPLTTLTYVWTLILSKIYLKEKITVQKLIAITLIIAGVLCIALGK